MRIEVNNNACVISGPLKVKSQLREELKVRHPRYFHIKMRSKNQWARNQWDGYIRYISELGSFSTGHLPSVISLLESYGEKVEFIDNRTRIPKPAEVVKSLRGFELRDYQRKAVESIVFNKIGIGDSKIPFPIGIVKAATNAGKNLIIASIFASYPKGYKGVILLKEKEWYETACEEIPKMLPGRVGFVDSKRWEPNDLTICMAPTLYSRIEKVKDWLGEMSMAFVDECDLATSKQWTILLGHLYNCYVKVGLSGSALVGLLKKHDLKKMELKKFFGEMVFEISKKMLMDLGYSAKLKVNILKGNTKPGIKGDFEKEYSKRIIKNKERNRLIVKRVAKYYAKGVYPILVICKNHKHLEILYNLMANSDKLTGANIDLVHHKTPNRRAIIKNFTLGNINILIASYIVKRAKNFPLLKYICNASAGDSHETVLQIMGRGERKHESKKKTIFEDFYDEGYYLRLHSKHRIIYYKKEGIEVVERYKNF